MIYKIMGDFDFKSLDYIFQKSGSFFKFVFKNKSLYLSLINIEDKEKALQVMNNIFQDKNRFLIIEITEKNIMNEDKFIIEWCRDNFVILEKQRYELENQEKIKNMMLVLDSFENILDNMRKEGLNVKGNKQTNKEKRKTKEGT